GMAMVSLHHDNFGRLIDVNEALIELVGEAKATALKNEFTKYLHPDDLDEVLEVALAAARGDVDRLDRELQLIRPDRAMVWARRRAAAVRDELDDYAYAIVHVTDISERRAIEEELERLALHDPLTGLPNRRLLVDRLGHAIRALDRHAAPVTVMYLDLD